MVLRTTTPIDLFQREIAALRSHEQGIFDGHRDSIHDARIATRRLREVLPLTHEWQRRDHADQLFTMVKRMGKSLGRVRDSDTRIALLEYLEARVPHAAPSLVLVRQGEQRHRLSMMRKLIKKFERLGVTGELARLAEAGTWRRTSLWVARSGAWRARLRHLVAERAAAAFDAIVHATGVYFPNRVHAARIDLKKFRYAAEIAVATGLLDEGERLRPLKKTQDVLGDLHDRQTLIDELREDRERSADATQLALVQQVLEAEVTQLHARFLTRRAEIRALCDAIRADLQPRNIVAAGGTIAAAALALASGLEARRRLRARRDEIDEPSSSLSLRIAVPLRDASLK